MNQELQNSFTQLKNRLESGVLQQRFYGFDPYDGLNSPIIQKTILGRSRLVRLFWIQLFKRNPFNLRDLVGIKKHRNPQSLGLFLSAYSKLYRAEPSDELLETINWLVQALEEDSIKGYSGYCWGYPFDWQAKAFFQPEKTPMIVPTAFAVSGLLDAYAITNGQREIEMARSSAEFVVNDLNRTYANDLFAFSYSPLDHSVIFNASLLASRLLSRVYDETGNDSLLQIARESVMYCVNHQHSDGSWTYGTARHHQWIDNFHTGYNLQCIADYINFSGDKSFDAMVEKGLNYYLSIFFLNNGLSKYYSNQIYPIDVNGTAQLILTLDTMNQLTNHKQIAECVLHWSIMHMQAKSGLFYFKKYRFFTNKLNYLRWSQAWMFYALATYLNHEE